MSYSSKYADRHRAEYLLERGVWKARCRLCAWETADPMRRQAMALFRTHIKQAKAGAAKSESIDDAGMTTIDLVEVRNSTDAPLTPSTQIT
jgi:hypothetical protein